MAKPTPHDVYEMILARCMRQAATTAAGKAIVAAGLGDALASLLTQCAGNSANPVHDLLCLDE
jgi:hypothetical protein